MRALERLRSDARVVGALLRGMPSGIPHRDRLDQFYRPQAADYDRFRERLLGGRQDLVDSLALPDHATILELGAGTGANLDRFPARQLQAGQFVLVDLCPALLAQSRTRHRDRTNVRIVESDAASFDSPQRFDAVVISYALSMMPTFGDVIDNALRLLRPGGKLAVVDFYLWSGGAPANARHGALARAFWSRWFAHDGVELDDRRLRHLVVRFPEHELVERVQPVPMLLGMSVPYFRFVGIKPATLPRP